jgi:hypothetical protein
MRLLNSKSLQLHSFEDERKAPPYAILSHTWADDELSFEKMASPGALEDRASQGVRKVLKCAEQAKKDGLEYFWVDTCKSLLPYFHQYLPLAANESQAASINQAARNCRKQSIPCFGEYITPEALIKTFLISIS